MRLPCIHESGLTGRARVRPGWFGRLILQVEVLTLSYSACPPMPGCDRIRWRDLMRADGCVTHRWRDAEWEDMQALDTFTVGRYCHVPPRPIQPPAPIPQGKKRPQGKR